MNNNITVYERRKYRVQNVQDAKKIAKDYLKNIALEKVITFGLPEVDDRYNIWRVPLKNIADSNIGEIVIDAFSSLILENKSTKKGILEERLLGRESRANKKQKTNDLPKISNLRNTIGLGDSEELLKDMPSESVDLIFTSPPYFNARPEYADYIQYDDYLRKIRKIIHECYRVLNEGRFFIINVSPVLVRRANRNESSKRLAVPFDIHRLFIEEKFEFIDDIIWVKPEGAGWATGRGRRFAADRNPLQYKPVPVTEYVLVYRKQTTKLIDWHIRKHPNKEMIDKSKIKDGYDTTNIWKIHPAHSKKHPAIFPLELAEKVIKYYSFINDVVLDPFAGIGTVGEAACLLSRRFVLFEINEEYVRVIKQNIESWLKNKVEDVNWINCDPVKQFYNYFDF
ncbi:MAG: site-specific DNA-methyltransferase [Candidatus Heimdallarchaeota archaeon]|nr:site-specific DNA-methyltransferase [Candidatus Heimdallarchaeota archaeon]